jgi:hypothetical protein
MLRQAQRSREVTLSSGKKVPSDIVIHDAKEGVKDGKRGTSNALRGL